MHPRALALRALRTDAALWAGFGCVPIVARTGGLADTIVDANLAAVSADAATGILFSPLNYENLAHAIARAVRLHADQEAWARIQEGHGRRLQLGAQRQDLCGALCPPE